MGSVGEGGRHAWRVDETVFEDCVEDAELCYVSMFGLKEGAGDGTV